MNIQNILAIDDFDKVIVTLQKDHSDIDTAIETYRKLYDGKHAILTDTNRINKMIGTGTNARWKRYTKLCLNYQKRIVNNAVSFIFGEPITLILNNDDGKKAMELVENVWKRNKLHFFNKTLARDLFVECKAAELWHIPPKPEDKNARIRVSLLSNRTNYQIYPHFDDYGDMDAFTIMNEVPGEDSKPVKQVLIYTATQKIVAIKKDTNWVIEKEANLLGKIPVVYYEQEKPEWDDVKSQIERMENLLSNFSDTIDYNGAPLLQAKGTVSLMPDKEESGKLITIAPEIDANGNKYYPGGIDYITWDQAPEAIKLEYEILKDIIYGITQTPDLSFSNVKGMQAVSGIALRLMFSDSIAKAKDKQEIFAPAMERRLSIIKSLIGLTNINMKQQLDNLDIDIKFNESLPTDIEAVIKSISMARGGEPIMSEETAISINPLVTDPEKDIKLRKSEKNILESFAASYE